MNSQDTIRQKYPLNAMRPAVQDEVIELINSEVLSVLEELEHGAVIPVHSPHVVEYVSLSAVQTLKERYT